MYGSVLIALASAQMFASTTINPELAKEGAQKARQTEANADLSGYYTCKGQEAGGKNYSGVCVLTKKNDVYLIQWVVGSSSTFSGIALRQGDNLSASWAIATDKGIIRGTNLYRIESTPAGPRLVGRWASLPGPGVQQTETLTFLKKLDPPEED